MINSESKNWNKYPLKKSKKDLELNRILDKFSSGSELCLREEDFLKKYDEILDSDIIDMSYLSKNVTYDNITKLLNKNKRIVCNLHDKYGRINDDIISIENDFEKESCILSLKHGNKFNLYDRFLYNINYEFKTDSYSLETQGEYFEKINLKDED